MKYKSIDNAIKDVDEDKGIVKFAFAHFCSIDSDGDMIQKGAYEKTIKERHTAGRIYHYKNHDSNVVVGKLLELYEEGEYGIAVSKMSKNTAGRDALIEYQEGIITEHSQGLYPIKQKDMNDYNLITEIKLVEVSTLTKEAANPNTPVLDVKEAKNIIKELNERLKKGNYSDEYYNNIQQEIEILSKTLHSLKPSQDTLGEPLVKAYNSYINLFKL